MQEKNSMTKSS